VEDHRGGDPAAVGGRGSLLGLGCLLLLPEGWGTAVALAVALFVEDRHGCAAVVNDEWSRVACRWARRRRETRACERVGIVVRERRGPWLGPARAGSSGIPRGLKAAASAVSTPSGHGEAGHEPRPERMGA
jgi:hypothetical protein